jgi:hypothetical protein
MLADIGEEREETEEERYGPGGGGTRTRREVQRREEDGDDFRLLFSLGPGVFSVPLAADGNSSAATKESLISAERELLSTSSPVR